MTVNTSCWSRTRPSFRSTPFDRLVAATSLRRALPRRPFASPVSKNRRGPRNPAIRAGHYHEPGPWGGSRGGISSGHPRYLPQLVPLGPRSGSAQPLAGGVGPLDDCEAGPRPSTHGASRWPGAHATRAMSDARDRRRSSVVPRCPASPGGMERRWEPGSPPTTPRASSAVSRRPTRDTSVSRRRRHSWLHAGLLVVAPRPSSNRSRS